MISIKTEIKCSLCGTKNPSTHHLNLTSDWNLKVYLNRGTEEFIREFDLRAGNRGAYKLISTQEQQETIDCALKWLKKNQHFEVHDKLQVYVDQRAAKINELFEGVSSKVRHDLTSNWEKTNIILDVLHELRPIKFKKVINLESHKPTYIAYPKNGKRDGKSRPIYILPFS